MELYKVDRELRNIRRCIKMLRTTLIFNNSSNKSTIKLIINNHRGHNNSKNRVVNNRVRMSHKYNLRIQYFSIQ